MEQKANPENLVRFGVFEADLSSGELRKSGVRLRLSGQPFQVLAVLLRNPGNVVTREDFKQELWPDDTFVDFENGVNTAIRKIRRVLDDSADTPRYVETLPRRGYRFIGQVEVLSKDRTRGSQEEEQALQLAVPSASPATAVAAARQYLPWLLFGVTSIAWLVVSLLYFRQTPPPEVPLRRLVITPPTTIQLGLGLRNDPAVAISPDGKRVAFAEGTAEGKLWVKELAGGEPRPIEHTEEAMGLFWSPDSEYIAFATGSDIKKVAVESGQVVRLCGQPGADYSGGSWSPDGEVVVFASGGAIYEVPAVGGTAKPLIAPETQRSSAEGLWGPARSPHFLPFPAGRRVLVFAIAGVLPRRNLMLLDVESGRREALGSGDRAFYSPTGHLVYHPNARSRTLMALPFSLQTLKPTGEAFPIAHDALYPSITAGGTLVYLENPAVTQKQVIWIDRAGNKLEEIGPVQTNIRDPDLSPNGQRVGVSVSNKEGQDVWIFDLSRSSGFPVTTALESDFSLSWSPSGEYVAFSSNRAGRANIFVRRSDGTGAEELLVSSPRYDLLSDWSWDGKYLLFDRLSGPLKSDIWYLERKEGGNGWKEPRPFRQTPPHERVPKLSPNGRYVAYVSDLSGQREIYVESFPEGGERETISQKGGQQPRWRRDGKELFYVEGDTLMAVSVTTTPTFSVGETTTLFSHPTLSDDIPTRNTMSPTTGSASSWPSRSENRPYP